MLPNCPKDRLRVVRMVAAVTRVEDQEDRVCHATKLLAQICIKLSTSRKNDLNVTRRLGTVQWKVNF